MKWLVLPLICVLVTVGCVLIADDHQYWGWSLLAVGFGLMIAGLLVYLEVNDRVFRYVDKLNQGEN